jgi:hypothetical protein
MKKFSRKIDEEKHLSSVDLDIREVSGDSESSHTQLCPPERWDDLAEGPASGGTKAFFRFDWSTLVARTTARDVPEAGSSDHNEEEQVRKQGCLQRQRKATWRPTQISCSAMHSPSRLGTLVIRDDMILPDQRASSTGSRTCSQKGYPQSIDHTQ